MNIRKTIAMSAAAMALAAVPVAVASPAQASTTKDGCTVSPSVPIYAGYDNASNVPMVDYTITVTCDPSPGGVTVKTQQNRMESDRANTVGDPDTDDETINPQLKSEFVFTPAGGTQSVTYTRTLPRTDDTDGNSEMYQKVRFKVVAGAVNGSFSNWELTAARTIWW